MMRDNGPQQKEAEIRKERRRSGLDYFLILAIADA